MDGKRVDAIGWSGTGLIGCHSRDSRTGKSALFFGLIAYSSFSEACGIQENQLAFLYNLHYMSELFKLCSMHYSLLSYVFASHLGDLLSLIKSEFLFDLLNWHVSG